MALTGRDGQVIATDEERQPCLIYSRVMGYFAPTTEWNPGKQSEWADRVKFAEPQGGKQ